MIGILLLLLSAFCEAFWNIFLTKSKGFSDWRMNLPGIFLLLIVIITFKQALRTMSLSIATVTWSGLSLITTIMLDVYIFHTKIDGKNAICLTACIASIVLLHYYNHKAGS